MKACQHAPLLFPEFVLLSFIFVHAFNLRIIRLLIRVSFCQSHAVIHQGMQRVLFSSMGMSCDMSTAIPLFPRNFNAHTHASLRYTRDIPALLQTPPFALIIAWKNFWATPRDGARLGLLLCVDVRPVLHYRVFSLILQLTRRHVERAAAD